MYSLLLSTLSRKQDPSAKTQKHVLLDKIHENWVVLITETVSVCWWHSYEKLFLLLGKETPLTPHKALQALTADSL
jgi:hypothetical protein